MVTLAEAIKNKVYKVEAIDLPETTKKHLNDLGLLPGGKVVLVNDAKENSIILVHRSRIALNKELLAKVEISENVVETESWLSLDQVEAGEKIEVVSIHGKGAVKRRLMDMGLTRGIEVLVRKRAPLGDPIEINIRGYELTLRKTEAELVLVKKEG